MPLPKRQFSLDIGGKTLTLEMSSLGRQANAAVLAKYGETVVLVTAVMSKAEADTDYLPLKVDYEERFYAAGKIMGSRFVRRESRPSEDAILAGRLVDRSVRPLFDSRIRRDIQVVVTVLAYDEENDPDFVGLIGASVALGISDIPWNGPVAGVRIAKIGDEFVTNPTNSDLRKENRSLEAFVAGPKNLINMIELAGNEAQEAEVGEAFAQAQGEINRLTAFQEGIVEELGKPKSEVMLFAPDAELKAAALKFLQGRLAQAMDGADKAARYSKLEKVRQELDAHLHDSVEGSALKGLDFLWDEAVDALVHKNILEEEKRPDGRKLDEIRELTAEVGLFARTHGSALFTRGETQALAVTTLAPPGAEQLIETIELTGKRRFMLHYNFPPYSVGEIGSFRGPGRREIGHGALAEKALRPLIPPQEEFPYTIRVVSELLSSNGSTSMATVCASSLSLMDAGVPVKKAAAGIAMGLMKDGERFKVLTDIQGPEDHHGDMDFKVAGTEDGITAIQLDVKIDGLTPEIVEITLRQAKEARLKILTFMKSVISGARPKLSPFVPTIIQVKISQEKIGTLIGPGGKMINGIVKRFGLSSIDVEEDGRVFVSALDAVKAREAAEEIKLLTREFKVGDHIDGRVVKILDFGAIVDLGGGQDGMVHVSELKEGFVKNVSDVVKVGDSVRVKVIRADEDGRVGLSLKQAGEAA